MDSLGAVVHPIVDGREHGWKDFAGWGVNYDATLLAMVELQERPSLLLRPSPIDVTPRLHPMGYRRR